jgi:MarR family transcriptional regulator, lower aerobic nicotinate degradation pathway regulator
MSVLTAVKRRRKNGAPAYSLDEQIGFILRQVNQRHTTLFTRGIGDDTTPTQWAALSKLFEVGPCSQNLLGRLTAMDVATIKGVVDRLTVRGLTQTQPDPGDGRRLIVALTKNGRALTEQMLAKAAAISEATLARLTANEREVLLTLLKKLR